MGPVLILIVGGIYSYIAIDLFWTGKSGLALAFMGYAVSNVGLWMAAR